MNSFEPLPSHDSWCPLQMTTESPAYKQFWPWFLFGLPGIVVVAGLSTWYIAYRHADQLVVDDYYKNGLAINKVLRKQNLAESLNISAAIKVSGNLVQVRLDNSNAAALQLDFYHPLEAASDTSLQLAHQDKGIYQGRLKQPISNRWYWSLHPLAAAHDRQWQIDGEININPGNEP